jgi:hypothetical protein
MGTVLLFLRRAILEVLGEMKDLKEPRDNVLHEVGDLVRDCISQIT